MNKEYVWHHNSFLSNCTLDVCSSRCHTTCPQCYITAKTCIGYLQTTFLLRCLSSYRTVMQAESTVQLAFTHTRQTSSPLLSTNFLRYNSIDEQCTTEGISCSIPRHWSSSKDTTTKGKIDTLHSLGGYIQDYVCTGCNYPKPVHSL